MTVEIKQLVIRAVVEAPDRERDLAPAHPSARSSERAGPEAVDIDAIVERCASAVLRTLERRRSR